MDLIATLFLLVAAHALCDFVLQNEVMAAGKNRHNHLQEQKGKHFPEWYYWMSAHAFIHGGAVYLVTGIFWLGLAEVLLHWVIDYAKCEGWINFHQDQFLHFLCKAGYCAAIGFALV